MSSSPVISVKNIGKKYKLGATLGGRNYKTLRDVLTQAAFSPFRNLSAAFRKEPSTGGNHSSINNPITQSPNNSITKSPNNSKEFWALKDISFDVQQGEVVGIIGRNGAGKSTLLKILSEITEPTEGEIRIRGRVASLLEVGTGFHPELSGRENVYMNGAILGMTKAEIDAKFDEIVAFAEVEKFIDTPIKRYSSGMQVRLAFAVAAHLEPEILLVDEVLAVGDMEFQKKCVGQMGKVAKEGRTVLFVSHNLAAIEGLCDRAIWLHDGRIQGDNEVMECVDSYVRSVSVRMSGLTYVDLRNHSNRRSGSRQVLQYIRLLDEAGHECCAFPMGGNLQVEFKFESETNIPGIGVGIGIDDSHGRRLLTFNTYIHSPKSIPYSAQSGIVICTIRKLPLLAGQYFLSPAISMSDAVLIDLVDQAIKFEVLPRDVFGNSRIPQHDQGYFWHAASFKFRQASVENAEKT